MLMLPLVSEECVNHLTHGSFLKGWSSRT